MSRHSNGRWSIAPTSSWRSSTARRLPGGLHHRFGVGDGFVLAVDEWESPGGFREVLRRSGHAGVRRLGRRRRRRNARSPSARRSIRPTNSDEQDVADMSDNDNIKTIARVYEAFGRGDVATILDALADDVDWARRRPRPGRRGTATSTARRGDAVLRGLRRGDGRRGVHAAHVRRERHRRSYRRAVPGYRSGHGQERVDAAPPFLPLHRRQDLVLPRQRGHRADRIRPARRSTRA